MQNRIVARYLDGKVMKGFTTDFQPNKELFHLAITDAPSGARPVAVLLKELKAVFFVKDFAGDSKYQDNKTFDPGKPVPGRKIKVVFSDGEMLVGTTQGYQPGRPGFFIVPADDQSNIARCFVVTSATREVSFV